MSRKPAHQFTAGEGCSEWNDPNPCRGLALFKPKIDAFDFARFTLPESSIVQASVHSEAQYQHGKFPDHPPYSEMICRAIHALEEGGGSTNQASISSYIKSEFPDLPWAHESFLSHHLAKLTDKCMITITASGSYMFSTPPTSNPKKQRKKQKQHKMQLATEASVPAHDAILSVKPLKTVVEKGGLPALQGPQGKPSKRRGRPPKAKQEKEADGKRYSQLKSAATIEAKKGLEKEQKEMKKRKGRLSKTMKMEAKKTKKDSEEFMDKHERLIFAKEKMVFYGPKKRRGRPPKAKRQEDNTH